MGVRNCVLRIDGNMTKLWGVYRDSKYMKSFKRKYEHRCLITGAEHPDPAHIRHGFLGAGMKPDDYYIIPLKHDLHQRQHQVGEISFWQYYYEKLPYAMRKKAEEENPDAETIDLVKAIAKDYYHTHKAR